LGELGALIIVENPLALRLRPVLANRWCARHAPTLARLPALRLDGVSNSDTFKRHAQRIPEYLEREEVLSIFGQISCATLLGQRDDALLRLLYNTGMRAQELVDLDVNDLRFSHPYYVRIWGKGQRERTCPVWKETLQSIKAYLAKRGVRVDEAGHFS